MATIACAEGRAYTKERPCRFHSVSSVFFSRVRALSSDGSNGVGDAARVSVPDIVYIVTASNPQTSVSVAAVIQLSNKAYHRDNKKMRRNGHLFLSLYIDRRRAAFRVGGRVAYQNAEVTSTDFHPRFPFCDEVDRSVYVSEDLSRPSSAIVVLVPIKV